MKNTFFKHLSAVAIGCLLFSSCKKDLNNPVNPIAGSSDESTFNTSNARASLKGNYSCIHYNLLRGYLEFDNRNDFNAAMNSLTDEMGALKEDKGQTTYLLSLIAGNTNGLIVRNKMIEFSPLSGEVLIAYLNKGYPPPFVKDVLFENIVFSDEVEATYKNADLPAGIRNQIDQERKENASYNNPVLKEFESRFLGFTSSRKKAHDAESAFLANGGDPESADNPANAGYLADDVMASLLNAYGEVKIGDDVLIILPDKDVKVDADKILIQNYIRQNKDIPRHESPASEPANGLPKLFNPAPVDPSISVEPNSLYNLNCGGVHIEQGAPGTQRVMVSTKSDYDPKAQYYWDFGDGFVSYKNATEHVYTDGQPSHTITVTVYNSYGVGCNPNGSGSNVFQTQGTTLNVTSINGLAVGLIATTTVAGPNEFDWTFGDGTGQNTTNGSVIHDYTSAGNYNITVNITHPDGTVDVAAINVLVTGSGGGGNQNVCDHLDRSKNKWLTVDNTHKFQHRLRLKNFFLLASKVNSSVNTYKKSGGLWYASATNNSSTSISGFVYKPDGTDDCGIEDQISATSQNGGSTAFRDANVPFSSIFVSVKENSVGSIGNAYGGQTTLFIKD